MLPLFRIFLISLFLLGSSGAVVRAEVISDLYEAQIPVHSQSREERAEALRLGLIQVLVKVSGGSTLAVEDDPVVELALENVNSYIQQYRYRNVQAGKVSSSTSTRAQRVLWIKFDEKAINTLLRNNGQPVWGRTRPPSLIWLIVAEGGDRQLLNGKDKHPTISAVETFARQRGLPIRFPYMDLTDRGKVSMSDIWGNFEGPIMQASARYRPEAVLVGRLYKSATGTWSARWSIYQEGTREDMDMDGEETVEAAIQPVIAKTAQTLAKKFAIIRQEDTDSDVLIEVTSVNSLADYNRVVKYLNSLTVVNKVHPVNVTSKSASFRLTTKSGRLDVEQAIELGRMLIVQHQLDVAGVSKATQPDLIYQLKQ